MARTPYTDLHAAGRQRLLEQGRILELLQLHRTVHGTAVMMADPADDPDKDKGGDTGGAGKDDAAKDTGKDDADDDLTDDEKAALGEPGQRALQRMKDKVKAAREAQAADAADAAEARRLREEAKPEAERRAEKERQDAERLVTAETKLAKLTAALEAGLDHTMAERLVGSTPEQLLADAKKLAEKFPAAAAGGDTPPPRRRTTSDADKGGSGPGAGLSSDIRRAAGFA